MKSHEESVLGIIGGTGLYAIDDLKITERKDVQTPFGAPSAPLTIGQWGKRQVAFLPRHGLHHSLLPSEINFRANIWALKSVGVRQVVSVSATGSLREELAPGDLALVNQYVDWTRGKRAASFFGEGMVAHISTAEPSCALLSEVLVKAARQSDISIHQAKTYACVEGPRLGSKAESKILRQLGCDLVGMTNVPEAFLAREAQLSYCTVAVVTDYDCWKENPAEHVSAAKVVELYFKNIGRVINILRSLTDIPFDPNQAKLAPARQALQGAVMTAVDKLNDKQREILQFLQL